MYHGIGGNGGGLVGRGWKEAKRRRGDGKGEEEGGKEGKMEGGREGGKEKLLGIREPDLFMLIQKVEQSFVKGHDILPTLVTN
jgi:hypothetical protein